jgi:hypothetical protein
MSSHVHAHAIDEIRKLKPHHLLVLVEGDEEPRKVAIPNVRNRWDRVATVLDAMRWTSIEARSKDGGTLSMLEPSTSSSAGASENRTDDQTQIRERDLLDLLERSNDRAVARALEAQSAGTQRYEALVSAMFEGVRSTLEVLTASTRAVAASYTQAMHLSATSSGPVGGAGDDGGLAALAPLLSTLHGLQRKPLPSPPPPRPKKAK